MASSNGHLTLLSVLQPGRNLISSNILLVTCKFKKDRMNSNREKWNHRIFRRSRDAKLRSQWWDLVEILTQPSLYACPRHEQVSEGSDKKQTRKNGNTISPYISLFGIFPDAQGQLTPSAVRSRIWSNFEFMRNFMVVPVT